MSKLLGCFQSCTRCTNERGEVILTKLLMVHAIKLHLKMGTKILVVPGHFSKLFPCQWVRILVGALNHMGLRIYRLWKLETCFKILRFILRKKLSILWLGKFAHFFLWSFSTKETHKKYPRSSKIYCQHLFLSNRLV